MRIYVLYRALFLGIVALGASLIVVPWAVGLELFGLVARKGRKERRAAFWGRRFRFIVLVVGGAFIKLGQILSSRRDLLPDAFVRELASLQDNVPGMSLSAVRRVVAADLGVGIDEAYAEFDAEPVAAGSIAQVHRGRLHSGQEVAIKVKRPRIDRAVHADTRLFNIAGNVIGAIPFLRPLSLGELAREVGDAVSSQLDFRAEVENLKAFAAVFKDASFALVPAVFEELCGDNVITMEFASGTKISEVDALNQEQAERLTENMIETYQTAAFDHLIVHADLHPGNVLVTESQQIVLLDLGLVYRIPESYRRRFRQTIAGLIGFDGEKIVDAYLEGRDVDPAVRESAKVEIEAFCAQHRDGRASDLEISQVLLDLLRLMRRHGISVDREWSGIILSELTFEGIIKTLDARVDAMTLAQNKIIARMARFAA